MQERTYKIIYYLPVDECKPGSYKGVTLIEAVSRSDASYRFQQSGIKFQTIDRIEEI